MSNNRPSPTQLEQYPHTYSLTTRWMDNDVYGHVNNVVYYSYFDTIINRFLIEQAGLDIHQSGSIGLMVQSQCQYFSSVAYPDQLIGGFSVEKVGRSSVDYNIAIFKQNSIDAAAVGKLTHVFVNRETRNSMPIPPIILTALLSAKLKAN